MDLNNRTKSLFEELSNNISNKNKTEIVESRAQHVIASAINLLESIEKNYPPEVYELLEKKLLAAIKLKDPQRFGKTIKKIK